MMNSLKKILKVKKGTNARKAYNLWAENYDDESADSGNLMFYFDRILFNEFLSKVDLNGKVILDFGCGTGRYWNEILKRNPKKLIGCDISESMISKLQEKFPSSETHVLKNNKLDFLESNSIDFIISTLVIAHIKNIEKVINEWSRVLKDDGEIFITDFHPDALAKGGKRTFSKNGKIVVIKNFVHALEKLKKVFLKLGFEFIDENEKIIDESVKEFYIKRNALKVYEEFKNVPMIYSLHLKKYRVN